jgi:hypothetical protein
MTAVQDLHARSMEQAELALLARMARETERAQTLFLEALRLELAALESLPAGAIEPTRSILRRSAATLALDCGDSLLAERLIAQGLADGAPAPIVDELRDLMEQVQFRRHLQLRGVSLADDELQLSLAGKGVGYGLVSTSDFLQRVDDTSRLIYRIAERRRQLPFRDTGRRRQSVSNDYEVYVSVPRAASFAVTLKLGRPMAQGRFAGLVDTPDIIDEFLDLMTFVDEADYYRIEERIPDRAYRTNFLQLARRLAPDGEDVRLVGFTSVREGTDRFVEVTRPKTQVTAAPDPAGAANRERITVRGTLKFADATHRDAGQIKIVEEGSGTIRQVRVPEGMMNDIVKPLWDSEVEISGTLEGRLIHLESIDAQ